MFKIPRNFRLDIPLLISIIFLVSFGILILRSISPYLFPLYFVFIIIGIVIFLIFSRIDFDILLLFANHFYILSIIFLLIPLILGQVTRGAIRWIPLGALTIQPAEIIRPFLMIFFVKYLIGRDVDFKHLAKSALYLAIPVGLIIIQPSLGVSFLTIVSYLGVLIAAKMNKRIFLTAALVIFLFIPIIYNLLVPYQKQRVVTFLNPSSDPLGAGYNSIQSQIAVGSGELFGRGLGKGVQTQLAFLPEKHTDFIFAAASEELGFLGSFFLLVGSFSVLFRLTFFIKESISPYARAYLSGLVMVLLVQILVNIGMNLGVLPITGIPLPLVSAGGSSFMATMIMLGIAMRTVRSKN